MNRLSYFVGKNLSASLDIALAPVLFLAVFISFSGPRGGYVMYFVVLLFSQFVIQVSVHGICSLASTSTHDMYDHC